jgi:hypothetical protein
MLNIVLRAFDRISKRIIGLDDNVEAVTIAGVLIGITFGSSDVYAGFSPTGYTFLAGDSGVHAFNNGVTLVTASRARICSMSVSFASL